MQSIINELKQQELEYYPDMEALLNDIDPPQNMVDIGGDDEKEAECAQQKLCSNWTRNSLKDEVKERNKIYQMNADKINQFKKGRLEYREAIRSEFDEIQNTSPEMSARAFTK